MHIFLWINESLLTVSLKSIETDPEKVHVVLNRWFKLKNKLDSVVLRLICDGFWEKCKVVTLDNWEECSG